ncbi:stage II sporulation protein P [Cytobacillus sp. FSL W7-1323]|nr:MULTISPECIES: stage II sporulation protein P [Cytobacillus]MDQ0183987.1 stage II sporulation protein P [Cytobacillus kochii]MEA1852829.1 stage II sporulation protein P [Cytobacillus sp. OWB-43]
MQKSQGYQLFLFINTTALSITIACIFLASTVALVTIKMSSDIASSVINGPQSHSIYLHLLKSANQSFISEDAIEEVAISDLAFKFATSITPEDPRTFLGRELPLFSFFDGKIHIAGKGTDYTTLPIESTNVPMDKLIKDKETIGNDDDNNDDEQEGTTSPKEKNVYIYHSHSYESYLPFIKEAQTADDAVSNDEKYNVISVGSKLQKDLHAEGIGVEHNRTNMTEALHSQGLQHNDAYTRARDFVSEALASNKNLTYIIDIHRDSQRKDVTTIDINGKSYARLFFVVGAESKNYEKNLKLAEDLNKAVEEKYPGLSRGVLKKDYSVGNGVYNQDLSDRAILLEVGGVDNNREELDNSTDAFADIFSEYYWKQKEVESQ